VPWRNRSSAATDERTVTFSLPGALATFPYSLTAGIIPQHILGKTSAINLRSVDFNTVRPVGSGPFSMRALEVTGNDPSDSEEQVALAPFANYVGGKPQLDEFVIRGYTSPERLQAAYEAGTLTAAAGLNKNPVKTREDSVRNDLLLDAGVYAFYKTTVSPLNDVQVRRALNAASNPQAIINKLEYPTKPVTMPILSGQVGYDKKYAQKTNDVAAAKDALQTAGWVAGGDGIRAKAGQQLRFKLVAADMPEYRQAANQLREQWRAIGARADVQLLPMNDYATALASHEYDVTLYGVFIGKDPDVYAYWHSSQADIRSNNRLNLSDERLWLQAIYQRHGMAWHTCAAAYRRRW
jgi:peptide/nickel transport system substrate-binding protein